MKERVAMLKTTVNKNGNTVLEKKISHGDTYYFIIFENGSHYSIPDFLVKDILNGDTDRYERYYEEKGDFDILNAKLTADGKIVFKDVTSEAEQKRFLEKAIRTYKNAKKPVVLKSFGPYVCDNEEIALLAIQNSGSNFDYCSNRLKSKLDFVKKVMPYYPMAYFRASTELQGNKELIWQALMRVDDLEIKNVLRYIPEEYYMDKGYMIQLIKKVLENNRINVLQGLLYHIPNQVYMDNPDFCVEIVKIASTNKNMLFSMIGGIVQGDNIMNKGA